MAVILSDELLARTHLNEQELRTELALWLYQTGKVSMGKAAELAELPKFEFQHLLAGRQIPVSYGPEEFARDLETVAHFDEPKQKLSERFRGSISAETAEKMHQFIKNQ